MIGISGNIPNVRQPRFSEDTPSGTAKVFLMINSHEFIVHMSKLIFIPYYSTDFIIL